MEKNITINLKTDKVAFTTVNREAKSNKSLKEGIINLGGIVMPGLVISSKLMLDMGYKLFDPNTRAEVTYDNVQNYPWTMADGQTRYLAAMEINKDAEAEVAKLAAKRANPDEENEEKNLFSVDTMSVFEYCGPAEKINDLIIILNNTGKAWNAKDYTHNKITAFSDKAFINVTYRLMQCKFTVSTISRIIAGKVGVVKKDSIAKYNGDDIALDSIDPKEGVELLHHLLAAGFTKSHLKKRYIWEAYYNISQEYQMEFLNYIMQLEAFPEKYSDDIEKIEEFKDDSTKIMNYLKGLFHDSTISLKSKKELLDLSAGTLESNLCFVEKAYDVHKNNNNDKFKKTNSTKKTTAKSVESSTTKSTDTSSLATTEDAVSEVKNTDAETISTEPMTSENNDAVTHTTSEKISSNETASDSECTELIVVDDEEESAYTSTEEHPATINDAEETTTDPSDEMISDTPDEDKPDNVLTPSDINVTDEHQSISVDSEDTNTSIKD